MTDGYYWFTSERSSYPSIAQCVNGVWHLIGESQPMALVDIECRGWDLGKAVKIPKEYRDG